MADAFSKIPILMGTWTVDHWMNFGYIDSTFSFLNLLFHMEGNNLAKEEIVAP
jgi:hypothetical protein